jgi:SAM-dependent methyltransferase
VRDFDESSYGDAFADVYDEWYQGITDTSATVARLASLAGRGPVLELGVGTGRIAIPLAAALDASGASGGSVVGIDASPKMLARLATKPGGERVRTVLGEMSGDALPPGPFSLVYVTYNTFFGLLTEAAQASCLVAVAARLAPDGRFVVEAFVPRDPPQHGSVVEVRSMAVDQVVLSVSVHDAAEQRAEGHFVELTEHAGVRLRPWSIRYCTPAQLDAIAEQAGLVLESRCAGWDDEHFDESANHHVSTYRCRL